MSGKEIWVQRIDFGLFVFIWIIQLAVYPSFRYFAASDLLRWHAVYTSAVAVVVMPLMISQVFMHAWRVHASCSLTNLLTISLVLGTWLVTFVIFVPLHNKIALNHELAKSLWDLVAYNWIRTALWSLIFFVGLFNVQD